MTYKMVFVVIVLVLLPTVVRSVVAGVRAAQRLAGRSVALVRRWPPGRPGWAFAAVTAAVVVVRPVAVQAAPAADRDDDRSFLPPAAGGPVPGPHFEDPHHHGAVDVTSTPPPSVAAAGIDHPGAEALPVTSGIGPSVDAGTSVDAGIVPAAEVVEVEPGDCLWTIAAGVLGPGAGDAEVDRYWRRIYDVNRGVVGDNPDLILPGQLLRLPDPARV